MARIIFEQIEITINGHIFCNVPINKPIKIILNDEIFGWELYDNKSIQYEIDKLKEENRILREGLGKYADHNNWGSLDKDKGWNIEELLRLIGLKGCDGNMWALETLAKADNVGKGEE